MSVPNMNYTTFINYIANQDLLPNVQTMSNRLNLSSRKIYYLLQSANSDLRSSNLPFLAPNTRITQNQITVLKAKLSHVPSDDYINSYERQLIIDICLALPLKKWTLSAFQTLFSVSRNTVLRDISDLKKRETFKPVFSKKSGFEFSEPLYDSFVHAYNGLALLQSNKNALSYFIRSLDKHIPYSKFLLISEKLKNMYQDSLGKKISISNALTLTIFSTLASLYSELDPIAQESLFTSADVVSFTKRKENDIINDFSMITKTNFSLEMPDAVKLFLTLQLLSVTKEQDNHFSARAFQDLLVVSHEIVKAFVLTSDIKISQAEQEVLTRKIQTQLKPFWYSSKYQSITVYDYLYHNETFEKYVTDALSQITNRSLYQRLFPFGLLTDQISILAMIFYNFSLSHEKIHKLHILMVTSLPIYSQNLFETLIKRSSSAPCELSIVSLNDFENSSNEPNQFDLIITESTEIATKQPTFLIDSELSDSEFDRLKMVISQINVTKKEESLT